MTPTKKILLAAAFVAAGYGVALQFGAPQLQIIHRSQPLADATPEPKPAPDTPGSLPKAFTEARARLVPDVQPPAVSAHFNSNVEDVQDRFENRSSEFELASVSAPPLANGTVADSPNTMPFHPRASLRNEAPRSLVIEPRDDVTVKDVPQPVVSGHNTSRESVPLSEAVQSAPESISPAQYSEEREPFVEAATRADVVADRSTDYGQYMRLPPVNNAIENQSRSHIIVDGDSLAKLAQRYLDDPQRANEIYELNRHVLSDPNVLPIGAQLTIPSRSDSLHSSGESPQSLLPHGAAIHAASRGGLVPVRPVPPGGLVMPRAHLAQPRPVLRVP